MKRAITSMAKVPVAGTVKTRLQPFLTATQCAELAAAFLRDAESRAKIVCDDTILAYSPADQRAVLENLLSFENILIEQTGADLGARMCVAFEFAFAREKDSSVLMIGTDTPTVPAELTNKRLSFENRSGLGFWKISRRRFLFNRSAAVRAATFQRY